MTQATPMMILVGGATVAGTFLVVPLFANDTNGQGKVGLRALQRFQSMPKTPKAMLTLGSRILPERSLRNDTSRLCWQIIRIEEGLLI